MSILSGSRLQFVRSQPLQRLQASLASGAATQLGVGPMSRHCVDAVIELANSMRVPMMLIASRRQIECEAQGGGYVNRWTTEEFVQYVRARDRDGYVVICRDHGGPWQDTASVERRLPLAAAMESAKASFDVDIRSGFDIVHLDPSIDIHQASVPQSAVLDRLFELYEHCMGVAASQQREIGVEVGSEEQSGVDQDLGLLSATLDRTRRFCLDEGFPVPMFVVAQTGTLVKETCNVGTFDDPFRRSGSVPAEILVPRLLETCGRHGICLKEHNGDYLSNDALTWHPRLGIHAVNVAPEFGVCQTRHIFRLCEEFGLRQEAERFAHLAFASGKWKKWMLAETRATDFDRAVIAGHYVFSEPEFQEIFEAIRRQCAVRGIDLDDSIRDAIKQSIMRIMLCLKLHAQ